MAQSSLWGAEGVEEMLVRTIALVALPFSPRWDVREDQVKLAQQAIYDGNFLKSILSACASCASASSRAASACGSVISIVSRLVLSSRHFARQFVDHGGISMIRSLSLLQQDKPWMMLVDVLLILSQLARMPEGKYYPQLKRGDFLGDIGELLEHANANVRSKACNLLGNVCRHSAYFYASLRGAPGVIPALISRCGDEDSDTRKFACFAIGNGSFHSDELYSALRPSVPILVRLLGDDDEKSRANAAGALGNLVRNSGVLCGDLARHRAPQALVEVAMSDRSAQPRRIALFSLGNFCVYSETRAALGRDFGPRMEAYARECADSKTREYVTRILEKLKRQVQ